MNGGERSLLFLLKQEVLADSAAGQALRDRWRAAVPKARWYGSSDAEDYVYGDLAKNGRALFPAAPLYGSIFASSAPDATNPLLMPTAAASCAANDVPLPATTATPTEQGTATTAADAGDVGTTAETTAILQASMFPLKEAFSCSSSSRGLIDGAQYTSIYC